MNAEISAFSPVGKTFSTGLDKTLIGYQEEGVIRLLKDIRDGLAGGIRPGGLDRPDDNNDTNYDDNNDDNNNDNNDDNNDDKIEEETAKRTEDF